ncbi:hypothetical protein N7468_005551 [Penicillium chermesinum]|uniref:Major facilitator superfamily (MFS) profile domain-containing protein n=1 Tax=Penicillium chermesinum TaxID=63820 RepID=A0A9W9NZM1_9EURO|nr:uncharacterized protein N7468_005551 [Penicillium chermesinum]KAJ5232595.1 hypothetical protein N7468_005551 [Penicillium chermesinum]
MKIKVKNGASRQFTDYPPLTDLPPEWVDDFELVPPPDEKPDPQRRENELDESRIPWVTWRSLALGAFVSIGGIIFGYDTGQISGFLEMRNYKMRYAQYKGGGEYKFSNVRSGLIVSMLSIGTLIGSLLAGPLSDRIGRKWSIFSWCIILHIGLLIQIASPTGKWYQMMMGRFVTGFGVGSLSLLVPMYQGEIAPRHIRGAMVCSYQLFVTLGIFVAYCINFGTESMTNTASWRIPLGITFFWALVLGLGILLSPESPRYNYRHGRVEEAKSTMARIYGVPENHRVIVHEVLEIQDQMEAEQGSETGWRGWIEMFEAPRMPYRIVLGVLLQALQQLTGANYFFYYASRPSTRPTQMAEKEGATVFNGAGISNVFVTQMILGGVNFGATFGGLYIIEHYGRRPSLIAGGLWITHGTRPARGPQWLFFACLFIVGFAMTWGPMVWAIVAELYPSRYRARAMAMATASNWLWNFLLGFFTPFITGDIDFAYGYVFAGCLLVAVLVVFFFVIEGKDKTLEEMDMMYVMRVKPWKSANWKPPAPEHRLSTSQLRDRQVAEKYNRDEESTAGRKQAEEPVQEHAENATGEGPSVV